MKKPRLFLLVLLFLLSITACSGSPSPEESKDSVKETSAQTQTAEKNYKDGVLDATDFFVKNGVAFWGNDTQLCSALLDSSGNPYDFVVEGDLPGTIYGIVIAEDAIYLSTSQGITSLPVSDSSQTVAGQSDLTVIDDHDLSNSYFQIYDSYIYFTYGRRLQRVPLQGGDSKTLEENIEAFQVTTEGVYCINQNGDLIRVSLDGAERKTLQELKSKGEIQIFMDHAYITTGDSDNYIYDYDLQADTLEQITFEHMLTPYHPVWVTEDSIYYETEDYHIFKYNPATQSALASNALYHLPEYNEGCLIGNVIYYTFSDSICWMHLDSGESVKRTKDEVLASRESAGADSPATDSTAADSAASDSIADSATYNIAQNAGVFNSEGQARLETDYFTLYLPADGDWSYEVNSNTSITIYYTPARESGNGGDLVTIMAFDWNDDSYADFPDYKIAGLSSDKKYVAVFPTDVQYSSSQEKGYRKMLDYVRKIDNNDGNPNENPFSCK